MKILTIAERYLTKKKKEKPFSHVSQSYMMSISSITKEKRKKINKKKKKV